MEKELIIRDHLCHITPSPTEPTTSVGHGTTVTILGVSEISYIIIMSLLFGWKHLNILVVGFTSRYGDGCVMFVDMASKCPPTTQTMFWIYQAF